MQDMTGRHKFQAIANISFLMSQFPPPQQPTHTSSMCTNRARVQLWRQPAARCPRWLSSFSWGHTSFRCRPHPACHSSSARRCPATQTQKTLERHPGRDDGVRFEKLKPGWSSSWVAGLCTSCTDAVVCQGRWPRFNIKLQPGFLLYAIVSARTNCSDLIAGAVNFGKY